MFSCFPNLRTLPGTGIFVLIAACAASTAHAADLTVTVKNLRPTQGAVMAALFDKPESFLKPGAHKTAQLAKAGGPEAKIVFRDLPPGRYALSVFQDENGNMQLDKNALGMPVEAVGFSRDAMGQAAPPTFDQAAVEVAGDSAITINLR